MKRGGTGRKQTKRSKKKSPVSSYGYKAVSAGTNYQTHRIWAGSGGCGCCGGR